MNNQESNILSFLTGIAIGTLIGVLIAPDKGQATRTKIMEKSSDFKKELEQQVKQSKERLEAFTNNLIKRKKQEVAEAVSDNNESEE